MPQIMQKNKGRKSREQPRETAVKVQGDYPNLKHKINLRKPAAV